MEYNTWQQPTEVLVIRYKIAFSFHLFVARLSVIRGAVSFLTPTYGDSKTICVTMPKRVKMTCQSTACLLWGTIATLDGFPPRVIWQIPPAFLSSGRSAHRSSSKGGDFVSPRGTSRHVKYRVSQRASIHAYDCFVSRTDFHKGRQGGDPSFINELLLCQHRNVVISSSSWKIDGVRS